MTEDKYIIVDGKEILVQEIPADYKGIIIGRNPIYTAEEIAAQQAQQADIQAQKDAAQAREDAINQLIANAPVLQALAVGDTETLTAIQSQNVAAKSQIINTKSIGS